MSLFDRYTHTQAHFKRIIAHMNCMILFLFNYRRLRTAWSIAKYLFLLLRNKHYISAIFCSASVIGAQLARSHHICPVFFIEQSSSNAEFFHAFFPIDFVQGTCDAVMRCIFSFVRLNKMVYAAPTTNTHYTLSCFRTHNGFDLDQ